MARVLLVAPPYSPFTPLESAIPPLGLAIIASTIRSISDVRVLDMGCLEAIGLDSWASLIELLESYDPNIVGIGPLVTSNVHKGEEIARIIKTVLGSAIVVVGGPDPTFTYIERLTNCQYIDVVFLGESEYSFPMFVAQYNNTNYWHEIPGIVFRWNETIQKNKIRRLTEKDFNSLPNPAWDLFPLEYYAKVARSVGIEPYLPVESSRGCPLDCIFCVCTRMFGKGVRYKNAAIVAKEIYLNIMQYKYHRFVFNDDNATFNTMHIDKITNNLLDLKVSKLDLACSGTVNSTIFDNDKIIDKMRKAGFRELFMGCETPHPQVVRSLRKSLCPDLWHSLINRAIKKCRNNDIASRTNWILGLPFETKDTFKQTISFIENLRPDSALLSLLQPYPGTLIHSNPVSFGIHILTSNPSKIVASKFDPTIYTDWINCDEIIEMAYEFLRKLTTHCAANISGSPYYIFELWREKYGSKKSCQKQEIS